MLPENINRGLWIEAECFYPRVVCATCGRLCLEHWSSGNHLVDAPEIEEKYREIVSARTAAALAGKPQRDAAENGGSGSGGFLGMKFRKATVVRSRHASGPPLAGKSESPIAVPRVELMDDVDVTGGGGWGWEAEKLREYAAPRIVALPPPSPYVWQPAANFTYNCIYQTGSDVILWSPWIARIDVTQYAAEARRGR